MPLIVVRRFRQMLIGVAITVVALLSLELCSGFKPLYLLLPASYIERDILKQIPAGSTKNDVEAFLQLKGWRVWFRSDTHGPRRESGEVIGSMQIQADVGRHRLFLFPSTVEVFFGFDRQGCLLGVYVRKATDAM